MPDEVAYVEVNMDLRNKIAALFNESQTGIKTQFLVLLWMATESIVVMCKEGNLSVEDNIAACPELMNTFRETPAFEAGCEEIPYAKH